MAAADGALTIDEVSADPMVLLRSDASAIRELVADLQHPEGGRWPEGEVDDFIHVVSILRELVETLADTPEDRDALDGLQHDLWALLDRYDQRPQVAFFWEFLYATADDIHLSIDMRPAPKGVSGQPAPPPPDLFSTPAGALWISHIIRRLDGARLRDIGRCEECGTVFVGRPQGRRRRFCSDVCRTQHGRR